MVSVVVIVVTVDVVVLVVDEVAVMDILQEQATTKANVGEWQWSILECQYTKSVSVGSAISAGLLCSSNNNSTSCTKDAA